MISSLVPAILRHLGAYVEIAGEDARDAAATVARRLAALLLAAVAANIALLMLCAWLLALAWDGPWRSWVAAGLAIFFGAACAALAIPALRRRPQREDALFPRVRSELSRDRELIQRALDGGDHVAG